MAAETTLNYGLSLSSTAGPTSAAEMQRRGLKLDADVDGRHVAGSIDMQKNLLTFPITPGGTRRKIRVRADISEGGVAVPGVPAEVEVMATVILRPPPIVDMGDVDAGCAAEAHCRPLDLNPSQGLWDGAKLVFRRKDAAGSAESRVNVWLNDGTKAQNVGEKEATIVWSAQKHLQVCIQPKECATIPDKDLLVAIRIDDPCVAPLREEYCSRSPGCASDVFAEVAFALKASWRPSPWWTCNRVWVLSLLAAALVALIVVGVVRPHRFSRTVSLRIASKQSELKRASLRTLRSCVGGRHGFYRGAVVSINGEGLTVRANQPNIAQFRAGPGSRVDLVVRGSLERQERGVFKPVQLPVGKGAPRLILEPNCVYRVNGVVYFEVFF